MTAPKPSSGIEQLTLGVWGSRHAFDGLRSATHWRWELRLVRHCREP